MPCTMGLYYSFLVTHKRAVYYTFSSVTSSGCPFQGLWLLLAGVGKFYSLIIHLFSLYFCVTHSHGSIWLSVWRFFSPAMLVFFHQATI
jgi:hypothetical protein